MKVYLVWMGSHDEKFVAGVFSSVEKAKEFCNEGERVLGNKLWYASFLKDDQDVLIEEFEVDLNLNSSFLEYSEGIFSIIPREVFER